MTQIPCTKCDATDRQLIGKAGDTADVYALRGGSGIDSVFQLGVAHAHIVGRLAPPALIVGLSTGAVHATAIAEILQASYPGVEQSDASMHRFREILFAYQDFCGDLVGMALPDAFEADAGRPLKPNPQAIHFKAERDARAKSLRARSGLIKLVNDLFMQSVTIRTLTRLVRAWMGFKATRELPFLRRWLGRCRESWYLFVAVGSAPLQCAQLLAYVARAWLAGALRLIGEELHGDFKERLESFPRVEAWLERLSVRQGSTAGGIIFGGGPRMFVHSMLYLLIAAGFFVLTGTVVWLTYLTVPVLFVVEVFALLMVLLFAVFRLEDIAERLGEVQWFDRVLTYYELRRDIGNDYLIEDLFIRIFDPNYHGELNMNRVVERAMRHRDTDDQKDPPAKPRTFESYTAHDAPIHVAPMAADLHTGTLLRLRPTLSIVAGLKAAVSRTPFLRPVKVDLEKGGTALAVDAVSISSDAAIPALDILRDSLHPDVERVRLFSVAATTKTQPSDAKARAYVGAVDVALGAVRLSAFRDADDERELIRSYNELIPEENRAPERILDGRKRALRCFGDQNGKPIHFVRTEFAEIAPAEALGTWESVIREKDKEARQAVIGRAVAEGCRATLAARLGKKDHFGCRAMVGDGTSIPGAREVCQHCTHYRRMPQIVFPPAAPAKVDAGESAEPKDENPCVSLLFSGGVFRGVFQIGVLNALNQLGVRPKVIAGSSVGSVVAAMIARIFTIRSWRHRNREIVKLAATFMTLDRLVITDRFADFARRLTLRAASARFSLRDADLFFRNYDRLESQFDFVARRVVGGIEHLFYVSPYELSDLVRHIRDQDYARALALARRYAQEICDRGQVSFEVLGAEPLILLIDQHVMRDEGGVMQNRRKPAIFLLTTTNFTTGELKVVELPATPSRGLVEALLASSAFPGIFRPRWARETVFGDNSTDQYIDGGVLDNLPIHRIVAHLRNSSSRSQHVPRPFGNRPHLVLTASLEPQTDVLETAEKEGLHRSWLLARRRAARLRYNQKVDRFRSAQHDLRYIYDRYASHYDLQGVPVGIDSLDVEVVVVKPKWLCSTFGFHPMLGFRRKRQAASIAHGCASTLHTIARILRPLTADDAETDPSWPEHAWRMNTRGLDNDAARHLVPRTRTDGQCHFRDNVRCPFSAQALDPGLPPTMRKEIETIYELCGKEETHQRAPD
jgi:predicted acylesterase/phospholipase RssA